MSPPRLCALAKFGTEFLPIALLGDLNGDGFFDVIMADPGVILHSVGVVSVYAGMTAVSHRNRTSFGGWRRYRLWSMSLTSMDNINDLVIGARMDDLFKSDGGSVHSRRGCPLFCGEPHQILSPLVGGDRMGTRVGVCDLTTTPIQIVVAATRTPASRRFDI